MHISGHANDTKDFELYNMQTHERVMRTILGSAMIFSVLIMPVPVNLLIILPLAGIYPCLTGIIGWDPLYYLAGFNARAMDNNSQQKDQEQTSKFSYMAAKYV